MKSNCVVRWEKDPLSADVVTGSSLGPQLSLPGCGVRSVRCTACCETARGPGSVRFVSEDTPRKLVLAWRPQKWRRPQGALVRGSSEPLCGSCLPRAWSLGCVLESEILLPPTPRCDLMCRGAQGPRNLFVKVSVILGWLFLVQNSSLGK